MTKHIKPVMDEDIMQSVWAAKEENAKRYGSAEKYIAALLLRNKPKQSKKATDKPRLKSRTSKALTA